MKRLSIILTAIALVLGMAQCKKTIKQITPGGGEGVYVTVTAGCDGAKTDIAATGITNWSAGDKLYVVGATQGYLGELTIVNYTTPSNWAEFAGNITAISGPQNIHFYYFGKNGLTAAQITALEADPTSYTYSIATQDGTLDGIENTMHLVHGSKANVAEGTTKFGNVTMSNMMAIARFDISGYAYPSAICNAIASASLNLKTGELSPGSAADITLSNPSENYYMALIPSGTEQTFSFKQNASDLNPVTKSRTIAAGRFYVQDGNSILVKHGVPGFLGGDFTVNSSGKKVQFSRGNLYCVMSASDTVFYFEDQQTDYRTFQNQYSFLNYTRSTNGTPVNHRGLFGFSTDNANNKWGMYPNSTSSYWTGTFVDWGNNPIVNGGNIAGMWHTLSEAEAKYMLYTRTIDGNSGENHTFTFAYIQMPSGSERIFGFIIYPDGFNPSSVDITVSSGGNVSWSDWQILEANGVVFLPSAGDAENGTVKSEHQNNKIGYYWTSTYSGSDAVRFSFENNKDIQWSNASRYYHRSVRLVRDASNGGGGAEPFGGTNW